MNNAYKPGEKRDPTLLYSNKACIYASSRPDYAPEALATFQEQVKLPRQSIVLDTGSGTGMLTRHLLDHYETVYALEPNQAMRTIAERRLGNHPGFNSLDARAEDIPLPDHSVDLIAVGQAIHWFEPDSTRMAFQRVSKPQSWLLTAHIKSMDEAFNQELARLFTEENGCLPRNEHPPSNQVPESYYFLDGSYQTMQFRHTSEEDWQRFLGGIGSAAYAPDKDHPLYSRFLRETRAIFDRFSQNNLLRWEIATEISYGHLAQATKIQPLSNDH